MPSNTRADRGGGGVAIVYKDIFEDSRLSMVASLGLEAIHMSFGARDGLGIVLAYRAPCNLAQPLPELVDFISVVLLRSPRLLVLGDFNIHTEAEVSGPAHEFLETMPSLDLT